MGTYTVTAAFPGSADYNSASAQTSFIINKAQATVNVTDPTGIYNGSAFTATATVKGVSGPASSSRCPVLASVNASINRYRFFFGSIAPQKNT